jgi:hypothetical protein
VPFRWLVPIVTILALAVQSIGTYANAGVKVEVTCCCPDITKCKCHDHDDNQPVDKMKRCAGAIHVDVPIVAAVVLPEPAVETAPIVRAAPMVWSAIEIPPDRSLVPEKPPF